LRTAAIHRALALLPLLLLTRCATTGSTGPRSETLSMPPEEIRADLALLKMNDEELFAAGSSAFAANDPARAADRGAGSAGHLDRKSVV